MNKFFTDLMLRESGIYTLWGSKPMTAFGIKKPLDTISLQWFYNLSQEEQAETIFVVTEEDVRSNWYQQLPEKTRSQAIILNNYVYDFHINWEKWKAVRYQFPLKKFILCERSKPNDPERTMLIFVNILETAFALKTYYHTFKQTLGYDFDPLEVIFEIESEDSDFWNKVLCHSELMGYLFGFGEKNVWCWHWKYSTYSERIQDFQQAIQTGQLENFDIREIDKVSINHFPLPSFVSFSQEDPVMIEYSKEREKIKSIYLGNDFVSLTIKRLTSN